MEKDLDAIEQLLQSPVEDCSMLAPLVLAWIGDSIYTDAVRRYLITQTHAGVDKLNKLCVRFVRASAQAQCMRYLEDSLTKEEQAIVRRGRNTQSHVPKNAKMADYRLATAFESLIGYLYLSNQTQRLNYFLAESIAYTVKTNRL